MASIRVMVRVRVRVRVRIRVSNIIKSAPEEMEIVDQTTSG
jgi:hypothetical protein